MRVDFRRGPKIRCRGVAGLGPRWGREGPLDVGYNACGVSNPPTMAGQAVMRLWNRARKQADRARATSARPSVGAGAGRPGKLLL